MLDSSEVHALALGMRMAPAKAMLALAPVAHTAGNKMKNGLRSQARGHRRLAGLPAGISYEVDVSATEVKVEAGWFNPVGQGHLENIAAFGTSRNAPVMDIMQPLHAEVPAFMITVGIFASVAQSGMSSSPAGATHA